jgi:hypothetical protein
VTTVALEFVPPDLARGGAHARETAARVRELLEREGILERINALLLPGMIREDDDRPVPLEPKLDVLDLYGEIRHSLPMQAIVTQVTAFSSHAALDARIADLEAAGIERAVFVGVPRTLADGAGPGLAPADALERYRDRLQDRGVVLIPTRSDEASRFGAKVSAGASLALTQLLFSDRIAEVLSEVPCEGERPEVLLSFGYVPRAEERVGLIRWLIRDTTQAARDEMAKVAQLAGLSFAAKKPALVDLFRRATEAAATTGYPLGLHFECPYDFNPYAIEVFHAMLDAWSAPGSPR